MLGIPQNVRHAVTSEHHK